MDCNKVASFKNVTKVGEQASVEPLVKIMPVVAQWHLLTSGKSKTDAVEGRVRGAFAEMTDQPDAAQKKGYRFKMFVFVSICILNICFLLFPSMVGPRGSLGEEENLLIGFMKFDPQST